MDKMAAWPAFQGLTDAERLLLLLKGRLGMRETEDVAHMKLGGWHTLLYYYNYRPKDKELAAAMRQALEVWYAKRKEEDLAAAAAVEE